LTRYCLVKTLNKILNPKSNNMKNADKPVYPCELTGTLGEYRKSQVEKFSGLTKREYASIMCLQGLLVGRNADGLSLAKDFVKEAIEAADAILSELDKTQKP
jgi:hypothetical protein